MRSIVLLWILFGYSPICFSNEKAFEFQAEETDKVSFTIEADPESPLSNPCFVFYNSTCEEPVVKLNGETLMPGQEVLTGKSYDRDEKPKTVIWMEYESEKRTDVTDIFRSDQKDEQK